MNINEEIKKSLDNWSNQPVFIELQSNKQPIYTSAEQFKEKIHETSQFLKKAGIQKNYLVAMFLENSVDFVACFLGLLEIGAKPVALKLEYRKIELDEIFNNAQPQAVITEENHLPIILAYLKEKIVITRKDNKLKVYQSPQKKADPSDVDDSIASINYTYRGYGYPLGAMVPHSQYLFGAKVLQDGVQLKKGENLLVILPMSHIFTLVGCVFLPLMNRITSIIVNTIHPRRLFEYISEFNINNILAVPEIYQLLLKFKDALPGKTALKEFMSGGSILSEEYFQKLIDAFNISLIHGYGLTEFTPVSRHIRGEAKPGTIGPVCDGIEYKIISPDATNGIGEILIKCDYMTKKYYKRKQETQDAFENGWFKTGDLGCMKDNHLIFIKEKKDTRKINGNIIDLNEIKNAILLFKKDGDVKIFHSENTLFAKLKIASKNDFKKEVAEIKNSLKDKISVYKIPTNIHEY